MAIRISNATDAGLTQRALTTAHFILDLLLQVEEESRSLESLHWYGDIPDTQNIRDTLEDDIQTHRASLGRWDGNIAIQDSRPTPTPNMIDPSQLLKLQNNTTSKNC